MIPALIALLFLLGGYFLYGSAGHDDSHITFWASYTLSEFGEILSYNGDRIEQSSSLLLTVLTALLAFVLRSDVVVTGYVLANLCGALAILLTGALMQKSGQTTIFPSRPSGQKSWSVPIFLFLLATAPAFMLWNTSGMESTLAALCILAFVWGWGRLLNEQASVNSRSLGLAATTTFALVSVRPEMISLAAAAVFLLFIWKRYTRTRGKLPILLFYSTVLLCIALLALWRYFYFGAFMPLPVHAKVGGLTSQKLLDGLYYLLRYGYANPVYVLGLLSAIAYLVQLLYKKQNGSEVNYYPLLGAFLLLSYSAFILLNGGDWMESGRFLVPVLPLAAIFCYHFFRQRPRAVQWLTVLLIIALQLHGHLKTLRTESHGVPLWAAYRISDQHHQQYSLFEQYNQEHLRDMEVIDAIDSAIQAIGTDTRDPLALMSGQAGMVYYYTAKKYFRRVRFYDSRSLVEDSLLRCPLSRKALRGSHGLQLHQDGFFALQPQLQEQCGIPMPDLVYDINDISRELPERIASHGYRLIYSEKNKIVEAAPGWPLNPLFPVNFIMAKKEYPGSLVPEITSYYREKPLVSRW